MYRVLFCLCAILLGTASLKAQDKIYRKNGQILKVKIIEVSSSEVKYTVFGAEDGPVYILERDRIKKIEYQGGRVESATADLKDPEQYADQRKKAIKIDFIGPMIGYSQITFEKSTGVGKGYELTLGIIGAGKNQSLDYYYYGSGQNQITATKKNQFGVSVAAGYKFNKLPDFLFGRTRFTHIMQGSYVKPILYLGKYAEDRIFNKSGQQIVLERDQINFGALQIELGKQWVFSDKFVLDLYWGFGYGFDDKKSAYEDPYYPETNNTSAYNYINARLGTSPGFSITGGLKVGMLLK